MYSTRCAQDTARDAVQIFGGRGITKTGMGRFIEHVRVLFVYAPVPGIDILLARKYYRTVTFDSLLGGGKSCGLMRISEC